MNYQENGCARQTRSCGLCGCKGVICFLGFLLALAVGLILGAIYADTVFPALAAVIAFAAAIAAVIVALLICRFIRSE